MSEGQKIVNQLTYEYKIAMMRLQAYSYMRIAAVGFSEIFAKRVYAIIEHGEKVLELANKKNELIKCKYRTKKVLKIIKPYQDELKKIQSEIDVLISEGW